MALLPLAVDANAIIGEVLSERGRQLLRHPQLHLVVAAYTFEEVREKIPLRVARMVQSGHIPLQFAAARIEAVLYVAHTYTQRVHLPVYQRFQIEAQDRVPDDAEDDWHTVALALHFRTAIWTNDKHFLGCGIGVWTTNTLLRHLNAGRV